MKCSSHHFTFDKGKWDCRVFLYLMTMERGFLLPYITEAGFAHSKVSQI